MRILYTVLLLITSFLFFSCEKEEDALAPIPFTPGQGRTIAFADLGQDYSHQIYFDFGTGKAVAQNRTEDWELGFACAPGSYTIVLNEGVLAQAADAGAVPFESVTTVSGLSFQYDHPNWEPDTMAFKNWYMTTPDLASNQHIYVVDLGKRNDGSSRGYKKVQITAVDEESYTIRVASLDGFNDQSYQVQRDESYDFMYVSLIDEVKMVDIAPAIEEWDIQFTRFIHIFDQGDGVILPYGVTGGLLNTSTASNYELEGEISFDDFSLSDVRDQLFTAKRDEVGYDWKVYDFDEGYLTDKTKVYLIKDAEERLFKLRFLDFYATTGEKGYITFEYEELK